MKLILTKSFFNRHVQPTIILERDDCFVPTKEGLKEETEPVVEVMNHRREKAKKTIKTILIILGVVTLVVLGYYLFKDFLEPNFYNYKIH